MFSRSFIQDCGAALLGFVGFVRAAGAAPVTIPPSSAVAAARSDAGTGLCGAALLFRTQPVPLANLSDAVMLLNKPISDTNVLMRTSKLFDNINFRNTHTAAAGDFTMPGSADALFPYSSSASADPPGADNNTALRLRGYLNIKNNLGGNPMTFGVNCDDACSLQVGGQPVIPFADERIASRVTQQVIFQAPGLYPVEIIYYQNAGAAFLEWSRALTAEPEGNQTSPLDVAKFGIVPNADLFSAIIDTSTVCQECGAPGMVCATGSYCGDGLCQACNSPDHCGSACMACPAGARICSAGQCVECASTADCAMGRLCDTLTGQCKAPVAGPDGGTDGGTDGGSVNIGCQCQTGGGQRSGSSFWLLLVILGGLGAARAHLWLRRRQSNRRAA